VALLVVGDKSGQRSRWYQTAIPQAEQLYADYLAEREGDRPMSDLQRWRDSGHLERAVGTAGGQEAFDAAVCDAEERARLAAGRVPPAPWDHPGAGRHPDGRLGRWQLRRAGRYSRRAAGVSLPERAPS
jgi:hypothetical protein